MSSVSIVGSVKELYKNTSSPNGTLDSTSIDVSMWTALLVYFSATGGTTAAITISEVEDNGDVRQIYTTTANGPFFFLLGGGIAPFGPSNGFIAIGLAVLPKRIQITVSAPGVGQTSTLVIMGRR